MKSLVFLVVLISILSCNDQAKQEQTDEQVRTIINSTEHCDLIPDSLSDDFECGFINVPENHNDPKGKQIQISYIIIKAENKDSAHYPLIYLSGGPGGKTIIEGALYGFYGSDFRKDQDIILMDQRGIGYSSGLPDMSMDMFFCMAEDADEAKELKLTGDIINKFQKACVDSAIDLRYYNTFQNAADVGILMKELPYDKYNLWGTSYGTRLARIVQDMYPELLNAVIHDSPNPMTDDFLLSRIKSYRLALDRIFDYCETNKKLRSKYPKIRDNYFKALESLEKEPLVIEMDSFDFTINAQDGIYLLRRILYGNDARETAPALIHAFLDRKGEIIKNIIMTEYYLNDYLNTTMLLAVERNETYNDTVSEAYINSIYDKNLYFPFKLGFFDAFYQAGMTLESVGFTEDMLQFKESHVPTLIMVNRFDPVTPPENGKIFQEKLTNSNLLILDEGGHGAGNELCRMKVILEFIKDPNGKLDTSCLNLYIED
jgi:pimeloyl-ACP methyl ester carboxylesterase